VSAEVSDTASLSVSDPWDAIDRGNNRFAAAGKAGHQTCPIVVQRVLTPANHDSPQSEFASEPCGSV